MENFNCIVVNDDTDINECGTNNGGCEQTCNNTVSSYYCSCGAGYLLDSNGHNCIGEDVIMPWWAEL